MPVIRSAQTRAGPVFQSTVSLSGVSVGHWIIVHVVQWNDGGIRRVPSISSVPTLDWIRDFEAPETTKTPAIAGASEVPLRGFEPRFPP